MKQIRLTVLLKPLFAALGLLGIIFYAVETVLGRHKSSILFDIGKYENITYILQKSVTQPSIRRNLLPEADYKSLIDLNFTFTIHNPACDSVTPLLLILVHSAPKNLEKRKVIRETWGKNVNNVKTLFVLGTPDDSTAKDNLYNENYLHKDLLQGNFLDSYRNLTYKHVMGFKFVIYHCPQTKYVLKVDDDTCINVPLLTNFLTRDMSPYGAQNLLMCNVVHEARAFRDFRSKWRVTFDEYQHRCYPTYCLGWYILYSPDVIFQFYKEAQNTKYFWIDDVHVTGLVAAKLHFAGHTDLSALTLSQSEIKSINQESSNKCRPFLFGRADMDELEIRSLWEHIVNNPVPESITDTLITDSSMYQAYAKTGLK